MVSPFFNRFKLKNKSDRIIQNYDNVPEKGVIRPELLTRPNVGYLKVDRAGNEEVLPPLNTNSEYARRIRSLGAWEKAREAPTIPPAKYDKPTNAYQWPIKTYTAEDEHVLFPAEIKADDFRNNKLKLKAMAALTNRSQKERLKASSVRRRIQEEEKQESIADAFRRRKLLEKGAIGIGENKRSEQEDRAAERAREIYTAQKEKEQEVIASKFKETQKAVADNFRRRKLLEKGILGIEDNRISEQRAKAADDFRRHKLLKKGMLGIDQNRISEQETKAAEEKRNKYARGLELLDRFSNNKQNEALRTGFDALNNNTKEQREQEAIAAQREKERLAAEEKRNKYAKGLELLGKFGNRKQDEDLRNRFDAIGDRANEVNAERERDKLAAEEKRNRYVKGLELLGKFNNKKQDQIGMEDGFNAIGDMARNTKNIDLPKSEFMRDNTSINHELNTRGMSIPNAQFMEDRIPRESILNTRGMSIPNAQFMEDRIPREYNYSSTGTHINEEDKKSVMNKFAEGLARRFRDSEVAQDFIPTGEQILEELISTVDKVQNHPSYANKLNYFEKNGIPMSEWDNLNVLPQDLRTEAEHFEKINDRRKLLEKLNEDYRKSLQVLRQPTYSYQQPVYKPTQGIYQVPGRPGTFTTTKPTAKKPNW